MVINYLEGIFNKGLTYKEIIDKAYNAYQCSNNKNFLSEQLKNCLEALYTETLSYVDSGNYTTSEYLEMTKAVLTISNRCLYTLDYEKNNIYSFTLNQLYSCVFSKLNVLDDHLKGMLYELSNVYEDHGKFLNVSTIFDDLMLRSEPAVVKNVLSELFIYSAVEPKYLIENKMFLCASPENKNIVMEAMTYSYLKDLMLLNVNIGNVGEFTSNMYKILNMYNLCDNPSDNCKTYLLSMYGVLNKYVELYDLRDKQAPKYGFSYAVESIKKSLDSIAYSIIGPDYESVCKTAKQLGADSLPNYWLSSIIPNIKLENMDSIEL